MIGIFLYVLLVVGRGQNGFIGALALAIIMLPLISRSTQEMLALVPNHLREGSLALGVSKWRTILGVILPTTFSGILTGRDARDRPRRRRDGAAALHVVALRRLRCRGTPSHALASIPVIIFDVLRGAGPAPERPGVGGRLRADHLRADHEPALARSRSARSRRKLERG